MVEGESQGGFSEMGVARAWWRYCDEDDGAWRVLMVAEGRY